MSDEDEEIFNFLAASNHKDSDELDHDDVDSMPPRPSSSTPDPADQPQGRSIRVGRK